MLLSHYERTIAKILKENAGLTDENSILQWMESNQLWATSNYESSAHWLERVIAISSNPNPDVGVFYILVAGIIIDIQQHLSKNLLVVRKIAKSLNKDLTEFINKNFKNPEMKGHLLLLVEATKDLNKILKEISDDEKSFIVYTRNKYSHPVLNAYQVKIEKKDGGEYLFDQKKYFQYLKHHNKDELEIYQKVNEKIKTNISVINSLKEKLLKLRYQ